MRRGANSLAPERAVPDRADPTGPERHCGWRRNSTNCRRAKAIREGPLRTLVTAAALVLTLASQVRGQESVKIGLIMPLTGNAASAGQQSKAAVELAAEIVNHAHPELAALPLAA